MTSKQNSAVTRRLALGLCAALAGTVLWLPSSASAQNPQPAFYTYQAPGGAATAGQKVIALTFDDGPGPFTPQVLSVLMQFHVPATFFEIGENIVDYPQYTRELAEAGYPVEDHTWTHPDLTTIPVSQFPYQIDQTQNEIQALTGVTPTCVRPPYDSWNQTVLDQIAQRGLTTMSYSVDPRDWALPGVQAIVNSVVGAAFPGAVVDMHDGGGDRSETVAALPQIITDLESEGYTFVSICGATGPSGELVENGGFNGSVAGWSLWANTNWALYSWGQYEGTGYLATNSSAPGGSVYQDIPYPISSGQSFCASAELDAAGSPSASVDMVIWLLGGTGEDVSSIGVNTTSGNWVPATTCVTATSPRDDIRIQFYPTPNGGTVGIDAVDVH
jgi:peptidoglycan-N-acetylglucosamine deacetylase